MALQGHRVEIKAQSSALSMTDEATTTSDNISYQITDSAKRILDLNTLILVEDGGVATSEKYSIDYLNGIITFESSATRDIAVTGAYVTPTTVATAFSASFNGSADVLENTPFNVSSRTFQAGLITGTMSLSRYFVTDDLFIDILLNGGYKIIEYWVDATHCIKMYGLLNSDNIESPVEGLIEEQLEFQITNQIGVI